VRYGHHPPDRPGPLRLRPPPALLVISPYARANYVDHVPTDQSSILSFIEQNWRLGSIGKDSFDRIARPLMQFFDFSRPRTDRVLLDPLTGTGT
jgi:phospholipase C